MSLGQRHATRLLSLAAVLALPGLPGCDTGASPAWTITLEPAYEVHQAAAVYFGKEAGGQETVAEECANDGAGWVCRFGATPLGAPQDVNLLVGDSSPLCRANTWREVEQADGDYTFSVVDTYCVWPVRYQNAERLDGMTCDTTWAWVGDNPQVPPDVLALQWDTGGVVPRSWVVLDDPVSGLSFGGWVLGGVLTADFFSCRLWDEQEDCRIAADRTWNVTVFLEPGGDGVALGEWLPDRDEGPLLVACTDGDADSFCRAALEDCDDSDPAVHPGVADVCDGEDNDCDGATDEDGGVPSSADADADGYPDISGGADGYSGQGEHCPSATEDRDCDDDASDVYPGAEEVCDGEDNDCDGDVDEGAASSWYPDADEDGYGDVSGEIVACMAPDGYVPTVGDCDAADPTTYPGALEEDCTDPVDHNCDGSVEYADDDGDGFAACIDCDDTRDGIYPEAIEICNELDDDCDGEVDDGLALEYPDRDGDGYGDASATSGCTGQQGYVTENSDCDDTDPLVNPDSEEVCNGLDDDCDGQIDDGVEFECDLDGDGYAVGDGDCDDLDPEIYPGALEVCDLKDNDCDGFTDDGLYDSCNSGDVDEDADGWNVGDGDCDDLDPENYPGAPELCDGKDNDCDGEGDPDADGDGYVGCDVNADCNDTDPTVHPGSPELCNGQDDDCDGDLDGEFDLDGDGYAPCSGDCDDADPAISPDASETCNGVDDDCDDQIDEGLQCLTTGDAGTRPGR